MEGWRNFCNKINLKEIRLNDLKKFAEDGFEQYGVYADSLQTSAGSVFFISIEKEKKFLVIFGESSHFGRFDGREILLENGKVKVCDMSNCNCRILREIFPFIKPSNHKGIETTMGLGDRLGIASAGHIRLFKGHNVFPVLAQQSIRELNLTGRTYEDVLAAASWAVFQEGYTSGFGADGDHLKTPAEVKMALDSGFTMITLDCSEHIDNNVLSFSEQEIETKYTSIEEKERLYLESTYYDKSFRLNDGTEIVFTPEEFKKTVLIYLKAIRYTIDIYNQVIKGYERSIDFEMSIDETLTSTTPESHFFVASELIAGGVEITSLAPRFCGEFQKGIDYRGDLNKFEQEFSVHVKIAEYFGYKISVHSGSDKFSVFPIIGDKTCGKYHLKTAGTNWLEAVRVIAQKNPGLYRRVHKFALERLSEAKKYYHISADASKIPDIDKLSDGELPGLMDKDDSRQVLHITYGLILLNKKQDGASTFRDEIYDTLNKYESDYYNALQKHIGRHLTTLRIK